MPQTIEDNLRRALAARERAGTLRQLAQFEGIDFSSNDYLGLAALPLDSQMPPNMQSTGSTGSRLITGHDAKLTDLEAHIAKFHGFEAGLLFSSGYSANMGLLACLGTENDVIVSDSLIHASLIDGIRLSYAKRARFKHNDVTDLAVQLERYSGIVKGQIYVVVEALYSMDGDVAPLLEISDLCKKHDAALIVDEAHSNGVYGPNGQGLITQLGLEYDVFAAIYTFGKAVGLHGAIICGSDILKTYLINFCRTFIYTTAPPLSTAWATHQAYLRLEAADAARVDLKNIIAYFQGKSQSLDVNAAQWLQSSSPIQGLIVKGNKRAKDLANLLQNHGFAIKAILSPTVAQGQERLRISLHSFNTTAQIDALLTLITDGLTQLDAEYAA